MPTPRIGSKRIRSNGIKHRALAPLLCLLMLSAHAEARPRSAEVKLAENPLLARPISAPSYVLMDVETGRVLASRNMNEKRYPASTTKTMTALLALESGKLDQVVTISANPPKIGESSVYLQAGERLSLYELVEAAMIKSANDSCVAIAEGVAGSEKRFIARMNARAKELGAKNTHYMNPHGLHHPNHYTTAYDLALVAREAMKSPVFNEIIRKREAIISAPAKIGGARRIRNRNKLLFHWNECDGVKTGTTRQAGSCLVASATRLDPVTKKRWRLLSVVLHAGNKWNDSANLLLHQGFAKYSPVVVARKEETLFDVPIEGGAAVAKAVAAREIRLPLLASEQSALTSRVHTLQVSAPIKKGQLVAHLEWDINGRKIAAVPLVAREPVEKSFVAQVVPVAAPLVPSQPALRWSVYALVVAGVLCVLAGLKVRADDVKRQTRNAPRRLVG